MMYVYGYVCMYTRLCTLTILAIESLYLVFYHNPS